LPCTAAAIRKASLGQWGSLLARQRATPRGVRRLAASHGPEAGPCTGAAGGFAACLLPGAASYWATTWACRWGWGPRRTFEGPCCFCVVCLSAGIGAWVRCIRRCCRAFGRQHLYHHYLRGPRTSILLHFAVGCPATKSPSNGQAAQWQTAPATYNAHQCLVHVVLMMLSACLPFVALRSLEQHRLTWAARDCSPF
jgi:hypothetical protein